MSFAAHWHPLVHQQPHSLESTSSRTRSPLLLFQPRLGDIFPLPSLAERPCFDSSPSSRFLIEGASRLVQVVSGNSYRASVVLTFQPGITDAVTSGANKPVAVGGTSRPSDCNARSDAPAQATTSGRDPGLYYIHVP